MFKPSQILESPRPPAPVERKANNIIGGHRSRVLSSVPDFSFAKVMNDLTAVPWGGEDSALILEGDRSQVQRFFCARLRRRVVETSPTSVSEILAAPRVGLALKGPDKSAQGKYVFSGMRSIAYPEGEWHRWLRLQSRGRKPEVVPAPTEVGATGSPGFRGEHWSGDRLNTCQGNALGNRRFTASRRALKGRHRACAALSGLAARVAAMAPRALPWADLWLPIRGGSGIPAQPIANERPTAAIPTFHNLPCPALPCHDIFGEFLPCTESP